MRIEVEEQPTTDADAGRGEAASIGQGVECPLCGYDQGGAIAVFRDAAEWPMRGRCPECGLDWWWGDLLHPAKQLPGWFVENPKRSALVTAARTWRRALRPRRFWREVRVTLPIRPGRLVFFAAGALMVAYVAAGGAGVWMTQIRSPGSLRAVLNAVNDPETLLELVHTVCWPIDSGDTYIKTRPFGPSVVLALMWVLLMPLPFLVMRDTFMHIRVRRVHLLRIWAYSLAAWPLIVFACAALQVAAALIQRSLGWGIQGSLQRLLWEVSAFMYRAEWLVVLFVGAWLGWFWWQAITRYLRLPHARAVVTLMMLVSFMAAVAVAAYYPGSHFLQQIGYWIV